MPDHPSLEDRLATLARRLDDAAPPVRPEDVVARPVTITRARPRAHVRVGLAAAAVVAAAAAGGVFLLSGDGRDGETEVAAGGAPATTLVPPTTAFVPPSQPTSTGTIAIDEARIPDVALAAIDYEADEVLLLAWDGTELGRGRLGGWYTNRRDRGVILQTADGGVVVSEGPPLADAVPGCEPVHRGGDLRTGVCVPLAGPSAVPQPGNTTEIRRIEPDGTSSLISGPLFEVGHWRYALPSPDGHWVLAQWSAECEVPIAFLFDVRTGRRRSVGSNELDTSAAIGWAPDGRAVVGLGAGGCGSGTDPPGTYLLDPATGHRQLLHRWDVSIVRR